MSNEKVTETVPPQDAPAARPLSEAEVVALFCDTLDASGRPSAP